MSQDIQEKKKENSGKSEEILFEMLWGYGVPLQNPRKNKNNNNKNSSYIKDTHLKVYQKPGTKSMMKIFKFLLVYPM